MTNETSGILERLSFIENQTKIVRICKDGRGSETPYSFEYLKPRRHGV